MSFWQVISTYWQDISDWLDNLDWLDISTMFYNFSVPIIMLLTAGVATIGWRTWRQKVLGKASIEAAQNLLRATLKIKDAIAECRLQLPRPHEFPRNYDANSDNPKNEAKAFDYLYRNRIKLVLAARREFNASVREARILWGVEVEKKAAKISEYVDELHLAQMQVVGIKWMNNESLEKNTKHIKKIKSIVGCYQSNVPFRHSSGKNAFTTKVESVVAEIEAIARPHLN